MSKLATANFTLLILSFVTGPLQARALGPSGRGELAAILVPLGLLATVSSLGLGSYAIFAAARERDLGVILGTIGALLAGLGILVAAAGVPLAHFLAQGRDVVFIFLLIGFALAPATLLGLLLVDVSVGVQDWRSVIRSRVCSVLIASVPIPILYAIGHLTVATAAITTIAAIVGFVFPLLAVRRRRLHLRWSSAVAREGFGYGLKAWTGGLTNVTNARLDQLLMIRLVSSADLGRYAVAVSLSTFFLSPVINALMLGTTSRIARGEIQLVPRSSRVTVAGIGFTAVAVAALSPLALHYLFGSSFVGALPAALILLAASVPLALNGIYASALSSAGHPGLAARAEGIGAAVTVPGLLLLLDPVGIVGAAAVSFAAYTSTCVYLLVRAKRQFGGNVADYLVPRPAEARDLVARFASAARRRVTPSSGFRHSLSKNH